MNKIIHKIINSILLLAILLILGITFFIAIKAAPNNRDSLHSHLVRPFYWMENNSIAHYKTHSDIQLRYEPLSGMMYLQEYVLTGSDRFINLGQWLCFLFSIIGVSLIAKELGGGKREQICAAVIAATIPMAMMQATSTQVDLFAALTLILAVYFTLLTRRDSKLQNYLLTGASFGLAGLAKTTNYYFAFPFLILLLVIIFKKPRYIKMGILVITIFILLNLPHYIRNTSYFGHPLGLTEKISRELPAGEIQANRIADQQFFYYIAKKKEKRILKIKIASKKVLYINVTVNNKTQLKKIAIGPTISDKYIDGEWFELGEISLEARNNKVLISSENKALPKILEANLTNL